MDELVRWLTACLDEDERTARVTVWDGSGNKLDWELSASATIDVGGDEFYVGDRTIANHMMVWDPARVLREIDAKRRIIELHAYPSGHGCSTTDETGYNLNYDEVSPEDACTTLRLLALPYADRPGYREEWAP